jgi:hypothetical protein
LEFFWNLATVGGGGRFFETGGGWGGNWLEEQRAGRKEVG